MPEDLKVALAEQNVLCEPGVVELQTPEAIADLGFGWADAMAVGCTDMQLAPTDTLSEPSGLVISSSELNAEQGAFLSVPFALDAAVLVVNITDAFEVYLSAQTIAQIFSGEITNWNHPNILADNSGIEFPNLKIVLPKEAAPAAKASLATWVERITGSPLDLSKVSDSKATEVELATPTANGSISIASYSAATFNGSTVAAILTQPGNIETAVLPATETIFSASTQLVASSDGDQLKITLDPELKPTAPEGSIEAALPYQAIFPVYLDFMGEESVLVRTAGRYLLRQESQGVISSGTMLPIPESVRILAVKIVEKGLPKAAIPAAK
jgi:phosphate transport system substrate-binding protein